MKATAQMILTFFLALVWCLLIIQGKASPDGLIVVATYAVKKYLDLVAKNGKKENQ